MRFADDILLFAWTHSEVAELIDIWVFFLGDVGFKLNVDKTAALTSESQPPLTLDTPTELSFKVSG